MAEWGWGDDDEEKDMKGNSKDRISSYLNSHLMSSLIINNILGYRTGKSQSWTCSTNMDMFIVYRKWLCFCAFGMEVWYDWVGIYKKIVIDIMGIDLLEKRAPLSTYTVW